jgi:hypothetical protein
MRIARTVVAAAALTAVASAAGLSGAEAQDAARIHLLHGIPATNVDVEAGGANVFEDFAFGETQDLSALAGETLAGLKVKAAGTDTVAIDAGDVQLPSSGNYTIIAHLDAAGNPTLGVFQNDTSTLAAGQGRLIVRHTAAAPAVDVRAGGAVVFSNLPNGDEAKADLPAGTVSADVVPTGATEPVVIGPADLSIVDGQALIVYAVGSLDGGSLTVLTETIDGLGTAPDRVNTGNSPIDEGNGFPVLPVTIAGLAALLIVAVAVSRRSAAA